MLTVTLMHPVYTSTKPQHPSRSWGLLCPAEGWTAEISDGDVVEATHAQYGRLIIPSHNVAGLQEVPE